MSCLYPFRLLVVLLALSISGCSIKRIAINSLADTLAASGDTFASDDDPELIRDAVPFSLKTVESLLAQVPRHPGLLLTACSGFTQYAFAFIQTDAELIEERDFDAATAGRERALKMYLRAREYCLRHMALGHPGFRAAVAKDPAAALAPMKAEDVGALYWTGASWGAAVSAGSEKPELIADLPIVRAIMQRALALDEGYEEGAIHEALISLEALPEAMGGSPDRARQHFERAVALARGLTAGPYVSYASSVLVGAQDRKQFEALLTKALAIDVNAAPKRRLANIIAQRKARHLMARVADLFTDQDQ